MRSNNKLLCSVGGLLLLSACGGAETPPPVTPAAPPKAMSKPVGQGPQVPDTPVKIGAPYQVGGTTYTPEDAPNYDEVGYAGWYGAEAQGNQTANGETFVASGVTAAHRTLPLPSYVEVTALDSGRTILVRINDRGPYSNDRIIDLSQGAAEQLGIIGDGHAAVRVRRVNPPEQERAVLRAHGRVAERLETPPALLRALQAKLGPKRVIAVASAGKSRSEAKPALPAVRPATAPKPASVKPGVEYKVPEIGAATRTAAAAPAPSPVVAPKPAPVPKPTPAPASAPAPRPRPAASGAGYSVQVAAFSTKERADALAKKIGASTVPGNGAWRVRYGPYADQNAAQAGIKQATAKGFENARIMANDTP